MAADKTGLVDQGARTRSAVGQDLDCFGQGALVTKAGLRPAALATMIIARTYRNPNASSVMLPLGPMLQRYVAVMPTF